MNRTIGIVIVVLVVLGVGLFINAQRRDQEMWQDGTYVGRSTPDDRGYFGEIQLTIEGGKITKAKYDELSSDRKKKDETYPYQAGPQSHPKYEESLIKTQDPNKVDVISGATETHERFKEATLDALKRAERGEQGSISEPPTPMPSPMTPPVEPMATRWQDGTYTAKTEPDQYGYYGEIQIMVNNGKIMKVDYAEKDQEGKPKGEDYPYPQGPESERKYEKQLLETQDVEKVEVITGATETWERFKETAEEALDKALEKPSDRAGDAGLEQSRNRDLGTAQ